MDLAMNQLEVDPALQPRVDGLDANHVRALQENSDAWPPLVVVRQQRDKYLLIDGFHRLAAAQNLGLAEVPIRILELPSDGDLHALAFTLNVAHGRPLSLADRRAFAERLLRQHPDFADREIGRRSGLAQPTVAVIRERLEASAQIEQSPSRVGAGGYVYTVGSNPKQRPLGKLPEAGLGKTLGNAVVRLFTPAERVQQRRIAHYLQRLSIALEDQEELEGWPTAEVAAEACRLVLGDERAKDLGTRLLPTTQRVLEVAIALAHSED